MHPLLNVSLITIAGVALAVGNIVAQSNDKSRWSTLHRV